MTATAGAAVRFSTAWAMPSRWTFTMPPVAAFLERHISPQRIRELRWRSDNRHDTAIVDPFCGQSIIATHRNDLALGGVDAEEFVRGLIAEGVRAQVVIFDPPYSPRQISECYESIGRKATTEDTQNGALYRRARAALTEILVEDGVALSFGWQSAGFGRAWPTDEILLVQHGSAHNDTICVAQRKPPQYQLELLTDSPAASPPGVGGVGG